MNVFADLIVFKLLVIEKMFLLFSVLVSSDCYNNYNCYDYCTVVLNADRVDCVEGEIRLNGTRRPSFTVNMDSIGSEGILELCTYGMWGSVCNPISSPGAWDICERIGLDRDGTMYICIDVHVMLFVICVY